FCGKIKLTSYPCIELGDVVWVYMGPPASQPPLPGFEWAKVSPAHRFVSKRTQECNYLQAMEGGIDSAHVSFLHRHDLRIDSLHVGKGAELTRETDARFEVVETEGGMVIGVGRPAPEGHPYWRITKWIMPFHSMIPPYGENALNGHAWVPIDDENCMSWCFTHHPTRPLTDHELDTMRKGGGIHVKLIPGTFRPVVNKDNDYMIDRAAQRANKRYGGVGGIAMQDGGIQESMGPIQDRSKENLVSTDNGVIMARIRLRKAALAARQGRQPDGIDPATHAVRSASIVLPDNVSFYEAAADALVATAGVAHTSVCTAPRENSRVTRAVPERGGKSMASKSNLALVAALSIGVPLSLAQAQIGTSAFPGVDPGAIEDLVIANRILANEKVLDGFGHVSIR